MDDGLTRPTTCGVGACAGNAGEEGCSAGEWTDDTCDPLVGAAPELCDREDNDCDGAVDDEPVDAGGPCLAGEGACREQGTIVCLDGLLSCDAVPGRPTPEACDGLDNDCDGRVDVDVLGVGASCDTGEQGVCRPGISQCADGAPVCVPEKAPEPEACDGEDNDCDGGVDEGHVCCQPGPVNPEAVPVDQWVRVCPGTFVMGSPSHECEAGCSCGDGPDECRDPRCQQGLCPGREPSGLPRERQHYVTLTYPFLMKATEVTQTEWERMRWRQRQVPNLSYFPGALQPVDNINWYSALEYCNWLSVEEGLPQCYRLSDCYRGHDADPAYDTMPGNRMWCDVVEFGEWASYHDCPGYRLPTEAEWEYAARAGTVTMFYETGPGEEENLGHVGCDAANDVLGRIAVYCANSEGSTAPVASKRANPWGLFDMLGNVMEWVYDAYAADYGGLGPQEDPVVLLDGDRIIRGGNLAGYGAHCRTAGRGFTLAARTGGLVGFRPVRTLQ